MIYYRMVAERRLWSVRPFFKQTIVINDTENEIQHTQNFATDLLPCT